MTTSNDRRLRISVVALDPPFRSEHGVLFGLQSGKSVDRPALANRTATFSTQVEIMGLEAGALDFRGEHVHGKKRDRFLYVSWGLPGPSEPFVMFARAKIKLAGIPSELIEFAAGSDIDVICDFHATNHKGEPSSGTINGDGLVWRLPQWPPNRAA